MSSRLGPAFGWLRRRVGFNKAWLAHRESVGTRFQLASGLLADAIGERSCPMAGGALAELNVAGPHAAERLVLAGSRAGGLLDGHVAARWLLL